MFSLLVVVYLSFDAATAVVMMISRVYGQHRRALNDVIFGEHSLVRRTAEQSERERRRMIRHPRG